MLSDTTNNSPRDAEELALAALAATLNDERRAQRFLDLTGLSPDELRARVGERDLLAATLAFLEAHEPDPEPMRLPDIRKLTAQENEAMIQQYRDAGMIPTDRPGPELAQEIL